MNKIDLKNLQFYSLLLITVSLPLPMLINNIAIIVFILVTLVNVLVNKTSFNRFNNIQLGFSLLFIISCISLIYTCDFLKGLKAVEKYSSFIVFPIMFSITKLKKNQLTKIKYTFIGSVLLVFLFAIIMASYNSYINGSIYIFNPENLVLENQFRYHGLMRYAGGMSATIFGIYLVFSFSIICLEVIKKRKLNRFQGLLLLVLFVAIFLINSFATFLSLTAFVVSMFLFFKAKKTHFIFLFFLGLISLFIFNKKAEGLSLKISHYSLSDNIHNKNWNSLNIRLAKWECALEVIKHNFPLGTGIGCAQQTLNKKYKEKQFIIGFEKKYSTHNQYLHYLVETGVIGFFVFIYLLISGLFMSLKTKNYLLYCLFLLLIICGLVDNVLIVNKGIVFFSFFICLMSYVDNTHVKE